MTELPGYDAWLSRGYDQDSAPCTCGHEAGDHGDYNDNSPMPDEYFPGCTRCDCEDYVEYTREEYLEDMRERRAEYRGGL